MYSHTPVLLDEVIAGLAIKNGGIYVDATLGGAGHARKIVEKLQWGRFVGIDRDAEALGEAKARLKGAACDVHLVQSNFREIKTVLAGLNIAGVDGILFDLGVSSYQLGHAERGFSYHIDAPLDMRMDRRQELSAYTVVNTGKQEELTRILREYGEERFAPSIARGIIKAREAAPVETTGQLVEIIRKSVPAAYRRGNKHPARRAFQAIRMAVNDELDSILTAVADAVDMLNAGGRICVITFHSLEDRLVKSLFKEYARGCECPPDFPVCVCGKEPIIKILKRKPISPTDAEVSENPRARSAKLRIAERC